MVTPFLDITTGVLHGDTLAPFLFSICLNYIFKKSLDSNYNLELTLVKRKSKRYPAIHITDIDYADDIAVITNSLIDTNTLLHKIKDIGLHIFRQYGIHVCNSRKPDKHEQPIRP